MIAAAGSSCSGDTPYIYVGRRRGGLGQDGGSMGGDNRARRGRDWAGHGVEAGVTQCVCANLLIIHYHLETPCTALFRKKLQPLIIQYVDTCIHLTVGKNNSNIVLQ